MILCLSVLLGLEATFLCATIVETRTDDHTFNKVMSYVLSSVYGLAIIIYIPLFSTVMERLRVAFPEIHSKIRTKVNLAFTCLILLLIIRYAIYLSLQFANINFFNINQLRSYVPFYVSELIISVTYICFLIRVYKNKEIEVQSQKSFLEQ